jgi:ATP-dependent DNA helicase PIF1
MSELSEQQKLVFNKFINNENIFISGPGGYGKSFLIKEMVNYGLENDKKIQVCALTGCASILLNCKATTVHRFAGIGLATKKIEHIVEELFTTKRYKLKTWYHLKCLIIDEVSMMSLKLLLIMDKIARKLYNKPKLPFGGLQVIFSGDFYQLPPIKSQNEEKEASMFCFQHELWDELFPKENQIILDTNFRQNDKDFSEILNNIRIGHITSKSRKMLEQRIFTKDKLEEVKSNKITTLIMPLKRDIDNLNNTSNKKLESSEEYFYKMKYIESKNKKLSSKTSSSSSSSSSANPCSTLSEITNGLNNIKLLDESKITYNHEFLATSVIAGKELKLKIGTHVMCVVNLALENQIANGSQGIVVDFKNGIPLVKFNNLKEPVTIDYYIWKSENNKLGVAQIPLIYGWAITIHKAQGITLESAIMDIGSNIFEDGQTYVALSRVKSLEGLYLTSLNLNKITINKKVQKFYNSLK